jgi:hypothetical protein
VSAVSVRSTVPCTVYTLTKTQIQKLIREEPTVGIQLQSALSRATTVQAERVGRSFMRENRAAFLKDLKTQYFHVNYAKADPGLTIDDNTDFDEAMWNQFEADQSSTINSHAEAHSSSLSNLNVKSDYEQHHRHLHHHQHHHNHHQQRQHGSQRDLNPSPRSPRSPRHSHSNSRRMRIRNSFKLFQRPRRTKHPKVVMKLFQQDKVLYDSDADDEDNTKSFFGSSQTIKLHNHHTNVSKSKKQTIPVSPKDAGRDASSTSRQPSAITVPIDDDLNDIFRIESPPSRGNALKAIHAQRSINLNDPHQPSTSLWKRIIFSKPTKHKPVQQLHRSVSMTELDTTEKVERLKSFNVSKSAIPINSTLSLKTITRRQSFPSIDNAEWHAHKLELGAVI